MKVVFLDVDGVLNNAYIEERIGSIVGIGDIYVKRLRKIIDATGAKIVLTSSWRVYKAPKGEDVHWDYLVEKLAKEGLSIYDCTKDRGDNRGYGILQWYTHHDVTTWVVLDDDEFDDYRPYGIMRRLVKTRYYTPDGGLQDENVEEAIRILNGEETTRRKSK